MKVCSCTGYEFERTLLQSPTPTEDDDMSPADQSIFYIVHDRKHLDLLKLTTLYLNEATYKKRVIEQNR